MPTVGSLKSGTSKTSANTLFKETVMLDVCVMENGEVIGRMTPEEFRRSLKTSSREFLSDTVANFNAVRESQGDGTRVKLVLAKAK